SKSGPVGVDGRAFSAQDLDAFFRIETVDDHLDRRTRQRQVALELVDGQNSLALTSQINKDALAAHTNDLADAQARANLLPAIALGARGLAGPSCAPSI